MTRTYRSRDRRPRFEAVDWVLVGLVLLVLAFYAVLGWFILEVL